MFGGPEGPPYGRPTYVGRPFRVRGAALQGTWGSPYVGRPFRAAEIYFTVTVQLTGADSGGKQTLSSHAW